MFHANDEAVGDAQMGTVLDGIAQRVERVVANVSTAYAAAPAVFIEWNEVDEEAVSRASGNPVAVVAAVVNQIKNKESL